MVNLYKPAELLFTAFCFICLGYMTENQIGKYFKNEDTSKISFKKFTSDKYPTYTLCFEDNDDAGGIYKTNLRSKRNPYFDGKTLRLDFSVDLDGKDKWYPNTTTINFADFVGKSDAMYGPVSMFSTILKSVFIFNKSYLIPKNVYKNTLKGLKNQTVGFIWKFGGPMWADGGFKFTYSSEQVSEIDFKKTQNPFHTE